MLGDDEVNHLHAEAIRLLQEHGMRVLLPEAREIFRAAGASVGHGADDEMVRIPAEVVDEAVSRAPSIVGLGAVDPAKAISIGADHINFFPVGGPPFVSDLDHGRRPGTLADYETFMKLFQGLDILAANAPFVEPQDIPVDVRYLHITRSQLVLTDKPTFAFTCGRQRVQDVFEMLRIRHGLGLDEFVEQPVVWANVNTNSPRQLDIPMALGIIDMARAGHVCVMTPFTLAGAMAPSHSPEPCCSSTPKRWQRSRLLNSPVPVHRWSMAVSPPTSTFAAAPRRSAPPRRCGVRSPLASSHG